MRLVVREYLSSLKEDQELDKFTAELLLGMDIITISKPQRGRQFGVDIAAYGIDPEDGVKKAFLVAVKQGDLDRDNWNSGKNAVRPTLDEIFDFYIPAILPSPYKELPKKIVVVCNGDLTQNVLPSWSGYTTSKSIKGQTEIVFWGVDELVLKVEQYLLNDNLFPNQVQKLLRRALALLDVNDYDLEDYYRLISEILTPPAAKEKSDRHSIKKLKLLNLCLNMLFKWAQDSNNLKPALLAAERTILNAWGWMSKHDLVNKGDVLMTFIQVLQTQRQVNLAYFAKVKSHCYVRDSFSIYGGGMASQIEYPLLILEQVGILASIGLSFMYGADFSSQFSLLDGALEASEEYFKLTESVSEALAHLIAYNPASSYVLYDDHLIDICLALILLFHTGRQEDAVEWVRNIILHLNDSYKLNRFFPLFRADHDKLVEVTTGAKQAETTSSMLLTLLAEWCIILKAPDLYSLLRRLITENYPQVNLQLWYPDEATDEYLYTQYAPADSGSCQHSIQLPENYLEYEMQMAEERMLFDQEKKLSLMNGFYLLGYIASRHFKTYPFPLFWRSLLSTNFCFNGVPDDSSDA